MSKWINMEPRGESPSGKTLLWSVVPKDGGTILGIIAWYAPWRKYCFLPNAKTVFEKDCLRDIAAFCEEKTAEHKKAASNAGV